MAQVSQPSGGVYDIGAARSNRSLFDFSTPAGWTMFWWFLSIAIILLIWWSL